jgi:methylphosphotriester-DNA--protein-cysteine methyltransferase
MTNRVNSNARIAKDLFDLHTRNVQEKHAADGLYMGIAAEMAIREYLDKDDGAELEERLRARCTSVGSSPPKRKKLVADTDNTSKKKAQWRIREELKEDLKMFAKGNDKTYSEVFALAIREYWTNSRMERIETLYDRLETAIEPYADQIGSDVDVSVKDKRTATIAMELGSSFTRTELETAIAEMTSDSDYNKREYTPRVAEYKGVEEHPKNEDLFLPREEVADLREKLDIDESGPSVFEQSFEELTSDDRVLRIQARLYREAYARNGKSQLEHGDILDEFDNEPGKTTGYEIMGRASELAGFTVASPHGTKKLRVDIQRVEDSDVIETAEEYSGLSSTETQSVSAELDQLSNADPVR